MAALSEGFTLCALLPGAGGRPEGLLGVEAGGEADRVLVTDTRRAVTLYKVSDQKPLGSWTVKQGQNITSPAVCNHETGEYIVVHDDTVLRIWKDDDVNLDKVFKATLSADVYRVHTCPDTEPLVVFKGGAVLFLDSLLADPQQEIETILSGEERIRWSKMFVEAGQSVLVYITEKGRDCFVCVWQFSPRILLLRYKLKRYTEDSRVLHFSGSLNNKVFTLLILCSNGHVCQVFMPLVQSDQESEGLLPMSLLLQLPEPTDVGAVAILDEAHIAVLAASPSTKKDCLCIWNTKFQTLQATKDLSQKTSAQLWHHGDKLYLPHGKTMAVVPYRCETSCLASALGKCRNLQNSGMTLRAAVDGLKRGWPTPDHLQARYWGYRCPGRATDCATFLLTQGYPEKSDLCLEAAGLCVQGNLIRLHMFCTSGCMIFQCPSWASNTYPIPRKCIGCKLGHVSR
ncbi:hypothetical protein FKM82_007978 [Ascaphus truei]